MPLRVETVSPSAVWAVTTAWYVWELSKLSTVSSVSDTLVFSTRAWSCNRITTTSKYTKSLWSGLDQRNFKLLEVTLETCNSSALWFIKWCQGRTIYNYMLTVTVDDSVTILVGSWF